MPISLFRVALLSGCLGLNVCFGPATTRADTPAPVTTLLNFETDAAGAAAAGWSGSGVVVADAPLDGQRSLRLDGRQDNDMAITPPLPAQAGALYRLSYRLRLQIRVGSFHVQFQCLDAQRRLLRPSYEYPEIDARAASLPRTLGQSLVVSLAAVEPQTAYVQIVFKFWDQPDGQAWLDDLAWTPLPPGAPGTGRAGLTTDFHRAGPDWVPFALPWDAPETPSPTNVSWLLDRPAGRHGFVRSRGGRFVFDDGTRARFLATTVGWTAWDVPHDQARQEAAYLARMGVNLVRLYPLGNILGTDPVTFTLDPDRQEKLDFLLAELRRRGIYVCFYTSIVQLQGAPPGPGGETLRQALNGGEDSRSRALGLFDPRWLAAEERYWRLLLGHVNPYTGRSLAADPQLAILMLVNENEMFMTFLDPADPLPPALHAEAQAQWNHWLQTRYGDRTGLAAAWQAAGAPPGPAEDPAQGTVALPSLPVPPGRLLDFRRFCASVQAAFGRRIGASLRAGGVRCPVQTTNSVYTPEGLLLMEQGDFASMHQYGPYRDGYVYPEPNYSLLSQDALAGSEAGFPAAGLHGRLADRPFLLDEWNVGYPNDFRSGGVVQGVAYGLLQDWDDLNYFLFFEGAHRMDPDTPALSGSLESALDPARVGLFPALALMFYRQDVAPARRRVQRRFTAADIDALARRPGAAARPDSRALAWLPYVYQFAITTDHGAPWDPVPAPEAAAVPADLTGTGPSLDAAATRLRDEARRSGWVDEDRRNVRSDTGQLMSDFGRGLLTIDTPCTQGASGPLASAPGLAFRDLQIAGTGEFGTVLLSSLDGLPLTRSRRILITAVGDAANTDEVVGIDPAEQEAGAAGPGRFHPSRYVFDAARAGRKPTLIEPVTATLRLRRSAGAPRLSGQCLDAAGRPLAPLPVGGRSGALTLALSGRYRTMYYLLSAPSH